MESKNKEKEKSDDQPRKNEGVWILPKSLHTNPILSCLSRGGKILDAKEQQLVGMRNHTGCLF